MTLSTTQLRFLKALYDSRATDETTGLRMTQVVKKARVSKYPLYLALGPIVAGDREAHNAKYGRCLFSRGLVKGVSVSDSGKRGRPHVTYYMTALGVQAYERLAEEGVKLPKPKRNRFTTTPATS